MPNLALEVCLCSETKLNDLDVRRGEGRQSRQMFILKVNVFYLKLLNAPLVLHTQARKQ